MLANHARQSVSSHSTCWAQFARLQLNITHRTSSINRDSEKKEVVCYKRSGATKCSLSFSVLSNDTRTSQACHGIYSFSILHRHFTAAQTARYSWPRPQLYARVHHRRFAASYGVQPCRSPNEVVEVLKYSSSKSVEQNHYFQLYACHQGMQLDVQPPKASMCFTP